jgi:xanthine dehydrogenase large subunit
MSKASDVPVASSHFNLIINGESVRVENASPTTTLLDYLRGQGRTGSKLGCAEGDCGACTVAVVERDAAGRPCYRSVNSCIALLPMFAGREIITVEGLSGCGSKAKLHPVQSSMVDYSGSQCGFCTPGFVVSLFEGYYRPDCREPWQINDQLCGNLCRCTGYRPIRDAATAAYAGRSPELLKQDAFQQRLAQPVPPLAPLDYQAAGDRFQRPTSLAELFRCQESSPEAILVAGATEIGVYLNKRFTPYPSLISLEGVSELKAIRATSEAWHLGAAATLTAIEEALAGEYSSIAKMLSVFAARQIRNRATLGGNLVTASPIGDSAPVLISLDAAVVLTSRAGDRTIPLDEFFTGYRRTQLRPGEILREVVLPRGGPAASLSRRVDFFKVSHRRELDISIVAAAFCVDLDAGGVVRRARLVYGGVAAQTLRARKAEAALVGQRLADAVATVGAVLAGEFKPISDVRAGAPYRDGVIVSLWEKFVTGETSVVLDAKPTFASREWVRGADASRQLRHESAIGHVTGGSHYVDDTARRRPMLEIWPVCSPHARARITRRNADRARAFPGVALVLLAEDVPGQNNVGVSRHDETLFAAEETCYQGHILAVVVGQTLAICRAAAALVEVDYEPLDPVVSIPQAIAQGSYHTEPHVLTRGDCDPALAASPHRLAGEFSFGGQEHFYLETQAAWAEGGDDGDVFISSSTQHPSEIQTIVAEVLALPRHRVVVQAPRMGGGFGGKETQGNTVAALVALAALRTGRPVRVQLDRDVDIALTGKRHPFWSKFEVGFDAEGRFQALRAELVSDGGWSLDLSQPVLDRALFHIDNGYYIPALRVSGRVAKTNVTSHTAFRGFGGPQGMLVIEEIVDRIARALGLPPELVRERNLYHGEGATNTTHFGQEIGDNRLQKMWRLAQEQAGFAERRTAVTAWNQTHPRVKRGLAITPVKFGISFTLTHYNQAGALVLIYVDGTVQVNHGGTEMGQGLHTKIQGVAMRELGLPADRIRMMRTTTDKVPNTSATAASAGSDLNGSAVQAACRTLRERLAPVAARLFAKKTGTEVNPAQIVFQDGRVFCESDPDSAYDFAQVTQAAYYDRVSLEATGFYQTPGITWNWVTASGRPFYYFAGGVAVAEVEVDGYSGMSRVLRVDIVHDVGDSLNPGVDRGQIEGGFVQGMGWLTSEELKWDAVGKLLTHSASTYQIPAISDAPMEFNVTLLPEAAQAGTIHGSKAVGEPPLMLAFAVREALRDAVAACGQPGGQVPLASPATGEAVFLAIQQRLASAP